MENNKTKQKKPRTLTIAENKRAQEIKNVLELRDEMIENKIDEKLIKKYLDQQYEKINKEYEEKIKKYQNNELKKQNKIVEKETKIKREKAINFLLKNKYYLEEKGHNPEYIKKYVEKQYKEINQIYNPSYSYLLELEDKFANINLDQVNFID